MASFRASPNQPYDRPHDVLQFRLVLYGRDTADNGHENNETKMNMAKILYKNTGRTIEQLIDIITLDSLDVGFFCAYDHKVWP